MGAGISGLSYAHFLSKKSNDFIVIEKDDRVGGNINSEIVDEFLIESGPNTVLLNNSSIRQLVEDYNLDKELIHPLETAKDNRFILRQGKLQLIPKSPKEFFYSPILSWKEKLRLFFDLFLPKHRTDTSVNNFIKKRFGKGVLTHFFEPFLIGIYAGDVNKMSAKYTLKKIWEFEQAHGSIIKGLLKQKKIDRPQIFNFSTGLSHLTSAIQEKIKPNLLFNEAIIEIKKMKDYYVVITKNKTIHAEQIISTIPAHSLSQIFKSNTLNQALSSIYYAPVDVFHFGFNKSTVKNQSQGFGVLTKPSDKKHFLGILFNSRFFPHVCPDDKELFTVIIGGSKQAQLCELNDNKLLSLIKEEVKELLECDEDPIFTNHVKYQKGIPQYHLNHNVIQNKIKEFEKFNSNFHILGNYLNGVSVSDCVKNAEILNNKLHT